MCMSSLSASGDHSSEKEIGSGVLVNLWRHSPVRRLARLLSHSILHRRSSSERDQRGRHSNLLDLSLFDRTQNTTARNVRPCSAHTDECDHPSTIKHPLFASVTSREKEYQSTCLTMCSSAINYSIPSLTSTHIPIKKKNNNNT